jgi:Zn-dependent M28 family amino/carboxypeptidase
MNRRGSYEKIAEDGGVSFKRDKRASVWVWIVSALLIIALFGGVGALVYFTTVAREEAVVPLWQRVSAESVRVHLVELQAIATNSSGNRAAGTIGYNRSVEYVIDQLQRNASWFYDVEVQPFSAMQFRIQPSVFSLVQPFSVPFVQQEQFEVVRGSMSGTVQAGIAVASAFGCNATDFGADAAGKLVLVSRKAAGTAGQCDVATVVATAKAAAAVGVIFVADGVGLRLTFNGASGVTSPIPAIVASQALQSALATANVTANVTVVAEFQAVPTMNVCASSRSGRNDSVILISTHLDSVQAGPGINDNGSGSMSSLTVALAAAAANVTYESQVRHCWWGAEELGLLGSTFYAASLAPEQLNAISIVANFDMLASPNGVLYINKVVQNSTTVNQVTKLASLHIEELFEEFFSMRGKAWLPTPIDNPGRSDYAAFLAVGIPAGGLATGAEEEKSVAQQHVFGGLQGAQMDPCYHEACDTVDNINLDYLESNVQAIAFTVEQLGLHQNVTAWLDANATLPLPNATQSDVSAAVAAAADWKSFEAEIWRA